MHAPTDIRILYRHDADHEPVEMTVNANLQTYQNLVGGYIETVMLWPGVILVCNADGMLLGMPLNPVFVQSLPAVAGPWFICGIDEDPVTHECDFGSLSDANLKLVSRGINLRLFRDRKYYDEEEI